MNDDLLAAELIDDPLSGALVQQILTMAPGQRLPSEREQAQQLGTSRTALVDAGAAKTDLPTHSR